VAENQEVHQLIDHVFRHEAGKLSAILTKFFGTQHIALVEDVVQDTLIDALRVWNFKGIPDNPSAWLHTVAKNKALNTIKRESTFLKNSSEIASLQENTTIPEFNFDEGEIADDQLRMIFTCCHPSISQDSQVALTLKTLCGFSIPEIARAFLTTEDTINKRLVRARQKIRDAKLPFEVPQGKDLEKRLNTVLEAIYLLFNEGYSASKGDQIIRYELCLEAIRLVNLITDNPNFKQKSNAYALLALMLLNASRFKAREDKNGNIITMEQQDRNLWDKPLIDSGLVNLEKSTKDKGLSAYHILATISATHCIAKTYEETDWQKILSLYDSLLYFDGSAMVVLNRSIALARVKGVTAAIKELKAIENAPIMAKYYLYYSTLGELYLQANNTKEATGHFKKAMNLAPLEKEKQLIINKLQSITK
jgi:RNA polymerase sigma-70 factor (ECF subfamily)